MPNLPSTVTRAAYEKAVADFLAVFGLKPGEVYRLPVDLPPTGHAEGIVFVVHPEAGTPDGPERPAGIAADPGETDDEVALVHVVTVVDGDEAGDSEARQVPPDSDGASTAIGSAGLTQAILQNTEVVGGLCRTLNELEKAIERGVRRGASEGRDRKVRARATTGRR